MQGDESLAVSGARDAAGARALFESHFLPLYPEDARDHLDAVRNTDANPAKNPAVLAHLFDAAEVFVALAPRFIPGTELDYTDASVHRLSAALTFERVAEWARKGGPGTADNELFNVVVHGTSYVGACIVRSHGGVFQVRRPLWESVVRLESRLGIADLSIFQWWLKSIASVLDKKGTDSTLADRYRAYVEVPFTDVSALPVIAPGDRALPQLPSGKFEMLEKYLAAYLPELRSLGDDFPAKERYDAYRFRRMDMLLAGGGRMLVMAGTGSDGLHLFWVDAAGFQKSVYIEAAPFPQPIVKLDGENVVAIVHDGTSPRIHNFPWWGP